MKKTALVVGTVLVFLFLLEFHCYSSENTIYGCYHKKEGRLRIVTHTHTCGPSEKPISWNITGPIGPAGPQGPPGPQGPQGLAGSAAAPVEGGQGPRVYDADNQFLGLLPTTGEGLISVFNPTLSKLIPLSAESGDIDPYNPSVILHYDQVKCQGNAYLDITLGYHLLKFGSSYITADGISARYTNIRSTYNPAWDLCWDHDPTYYLTVLPFKEVTLLPFKLPVALPLYFDY
jgi:hypothetical protein